jgi:ankyrin repeat protein
MEEKKPEEAGPVVSDSDEESQEEEISQQELNDNLLLACRENRIDDVKLWLDKKASALYEKDGWNPLLWAACNGNEEIVRLLIKHNACAPYLNQKQSNEEEQLK